jgi:hypothetical protein
MRFFAPVYIRKAEFWPIRLALSQNKSPIRASIAYHGLVTFVPVRADNVRVNSFDPMFLGNPYALNDLSALDDSKLLYAYDETGEQNDTASRGGLVRFATEYEQYVLANIYIPKTLQSGDILLCSRQKNWYSEAEMR